MSALRTVVAVAAVATLGACAAHAPREGTPEPLQGARGVVTHRDRPAPGAVVYAYRRESSSFLGPADFASPPAGRDGSYAIDLVEGDYWLVARRRVSGADSGPLVPGDLQAVHPGNPVTVRPGELARADFELAEMRDLMLSRAGPRGRTGTGIRGRILDAAGRPVSWVFAMAYATADMRRVPDHTSALTAEDGRYEIHLPRGGRYWVGARRHIRERPAPGEPYGLWEGTADHSVEVPAGGYVDGIDIVLGRFGEP